MTNHQPRKELGWFDSTSIIVGTIIGAGIFQIAPTVASSVSSIGALVGIWLIGGLISLCGAMCYAELSSAFPKNGGDFVYLKQAYGDWAGFLFGWLLILFIRPGDIAVVAFIFGTYLNLVVTSGNDLAASMPMIYAAAAVGILTLINILGVRQSKWMQNVLTMIKIAGLVGIIVVGLTCTPISMSATVVEAPKSVSSLGHALIFVLFAYGGWNEMAYIAAEVKNPERNMVRSLVSGTLAVTILYLLLNLAFARVFGLAGMSHSKTPAGDLLDIPFPGIGGKLVAILICVSTLATANGMILAGSRVGNAMGADHPIFRWLSGWNPRTGTPIIALIFQGIMAIVLIAVLRSFENAVLTTSIAVYGFFFATSLAVLVLRWKKPELLRPYRVTLFPLPVIVFTVICAYLIYSAIAYDVLMAGFIALMAATGIVVYAVERRLIRGF
jgi:amino acid transporter